MLDTQNQLLASIPTEIPVTETLRRTDALRAVPMRWIKSPAWDLVWILNALWLAPLVLLLARGHDDVRASPVDGLFFALTVLCGSATAFRRPGWPTRPRRTVPFLPQRLRFVVAPLGRHRRGLLHRAVGSRERCRCR
jgi:hypothetical protein